MTTKASIPEIMFRQNVEMYEICPSCGNRYVRCTTIEELFDLIIRGETIAKLPKDGEKKP